MRRLLEVSFGAIALAAVGCSSTSAPVASVDARGADGSAEPRDSGTDDADGGAEDARPDDGTEAGTTEIVLHAASFPIADGASVTCGVDFDGVVVFYAETGDPMPMETGIVPCATPVVLTPVDPGSTYQLDVYLQKGATVIAQSTCTAMTQAGEAVEPSCPTFM